MDKSIVFSSKIQIYDPKTIPTNWLDCPRKSAIIAEKFIAFKTPLDEQYKDNIPIGKQWTCHMLIKNLKDDHKNLGLVIDLTNTERYYKSDVEFIAKQIRYEKIRCEGHDKPPTTDQINQFIHICQEFIETNPDDLIGVHCTHGFNRTGFLVCAYLCRQRNYRIDTAIDLFASARSPGIYKQDYLNKLTEEFGNTNNISSIAAPAQPSWSQVNESTKSDRTKRPCNDNDSQPCKKRVQNNNIQTRSPPKFAVDHVNVIPICSQPTLDYIRTKCQEICHWNRQSFPGSQPVSMDSTNYEIVLQSPYMVSWKADGTRYMMLIEGLNKVYMLDRNNNAFQINNLWFPENSDCTGYLTDTLLDGEFVIDNDKGTRIYRFLVYDIVIYNNNDVSQNSFDERLRIISKHIVDVRNEAIGKGYINKTLEPFSIRNKMFWNLSKVSQLLSAEFQSQITHGCDGLVFQPVNEPYQPGRSSRVFKWKEDNTIDFQLKITSSKDSPKKRALLYLNNAREPFTSMSYSSDLEQYNNQIIECSYRNDEWHFYRHRVDKTYANALETAQGVLTSIKHQLTKTVLCSRIEDQTDFDNYLNV